MPSSSLAFSHLKRLVSIEQVLTARGVIASLTPRGQRLIGPCPVPHGDHPQAFVVDLAKDLCIRSQAVSYTHLTLPTNA